MLGTLLVCIAWCSTDLTANTCLICDNMNHKELTLEIVGIHHQMPT